MCLRLWVFQQQTCPTCRTPTGSNPVGDDIHEQLANLEARCFFRDYGCTQITKLCESEDHADNCEYRPSMCPNGCSEVILRKNMGAHMARCPNMPSLTLLGKVCYKCRAELWLKKQPTHCPYTADEESASEDE